MNTENKRINSQNQQEVKNSVKEPFSISEGVSPLWKIPLSNRIAFILSMRGMTQNKLADEIGVNQGTMSKIVNGHWMPTAKIKIRLGQILGVDSLVLFGDKQYFLDYKKTIQKIKEENEQSNSVHSLNNNGVRNNGDNR